MKFTNFIVIMCAVISIPLFIDKGNSAAAIWAFISMTWCIMDWVKGKVVNNG